MPVYVAIDINDRTVTRLHIARMSGTGRNPEAVHLYSVLAQDEEPQTEKEWEVGVLFQHRYGDGIDVLLQRALTAINGPLDPL